MRIERVRVECANLQETARFYAGLGLPVAVAAGSAEVRIGRSVLTLVLGARTAGAQ